jgi:acyl-coenzyme A synthetase/AMP-(fatty) acid ligase
MSQCTFDIHVQEVLATLMSGATLVMIRPRGNIDFDYLAIILREKQITYMHTVPTLLHKFLTFILKYNKREDIRYLRSLCSSGR